jgi:hypothetical protein
MRKSVALFPIDIATALFASNAEMSRNWRPAEPGGLTSCHVAPRSVVRMTTPSVGVYPLTQAVVALTAARPRKCAVVPVGVSCHEYTRGTAEASETPTTPESATSRRIRFVTARDHNAEAAGVQRSRLTPWPQ